MNTKIAQFNEILAGATPEEIIRFFAEKYSKKLVFATSLGAEDQVITHMIAESGADIKIFTLDTGRLFQETYDLIDITEKKYNLKIHLMFPESLDVEEMVKTKGINLFYESVENRKLCCNVRKVAPLQRALRPARAWISGLRREQSVTRHEVSVIEYDKKFRKTKINPILDWTSEQVWDYIKSHGIPYNTLHDKGYPSIGCLPCTRAILPGEDIRSGRWWWESADKKECGLHVK